MVRTTKLLRGQTNVGEGQTQPYARHEIHNAESAKKQRFGDRRDTRKTYKAMVEQLTPFTLKITNSIQAGRQLPNKWTDGAIIHT